MAKAKSAPKKKAAKKKAAVKKPVAKKPAAKKAAKPKLPFYATLLSKQETTGLKATSKDNDSIQTKKYPNDEADVVYKNEAGRVAAFPGAMTSKRTDQVVVTLKYPSDSDEAITMKYPSDDDELTTEKWFSDKGWQTRKYPSDNDEDATLNTEYPADLVTARYPSDEYAAAVDILESHKPVKGLAPIRTAVGKDSYQTLKYPSDRDEDLRTLKYPSDSDEPIIT